MRVCCTVVAVCMGLVNGVLGGTIVSNLTAVQQEGTKTVVLTYDLGGTSQALIDVNLDSGGSSVNAQSLTGAFGLVDPGTARTIFWDAGNDWGGQTGTLDVALRAEDGLPFSRPYDGGPSAIPRTGQTASYSATFGEDGDIKPGLPWPAPRFTLDAARGLVTDNLTGLMWRQAVQNTTTYNSAIDAADSMSYGGYTDWRVPNVREMRSLFAYNQQSGDCLPSDHPFTGFPGTLRWLWTSTAHTQIPSSYKTSVKSTTGETYGMYETMPQQYMVVRDTSDGPAALAKTGQSSGYEYAYGEDGELRNGYTWPSPRFTNQGGGVIVDNLTGLMWSQNSYGSGSWEAALSSAQSVTLGGYDDWRLPSVNEIEILVAYNTSSPALPSGHPFQSIHAGSSDFYWSSTTVAPQGYTGYAYTCLMFNGNLLYKQKTSSGYWLVCRGGVAIGGEQPDDPDAAVPLAKTGQTTSYRTGDDGDVEAGVTPPATRFSLSGDLVTDNLTGLMWYRRMQTYGSWSYAVSAAYSSTLGGYTDWRLPNIRELLTLMDWSRAYPALPAGHPFIYSSYNIWSSTTYSLGTGSAWRLDMSTGLAGTANKGSNLYFTYVRGYVAAPIAPVAKTGQTYPYQTGDDGWIEFGNSVSGDRFTDNGNGTVNDNQSGLMWLKTPHAIAATDWNAAVDACAAMTYGGYTDWRLPNQRELESLLDYGAGGLPAGHPFSTLDVNADPAQGKFWTSTTLSADPNRAHYLDFRQHGKAGYQYKSTIYKYNVWPVRAGN